MNNDYKSKISAMLDHKIKKQKEIAQEQIDEEADMKHLILQRLVEAQKEVAFSSIDDWKERMMRKHKSKQHLCDETDYEKFEVY